MSDALSQSQIDDLLNSLSGQDDKSIEEIEQSVKEKKVKPYDFRTPKKFTKERIRILNRVYEIYSRLLSSYFTGLLRTYCKVSVVTIEEQRYYEFSNALPECVFVSIMDFGVKMEDMDDITFLMQISNPVAFTMLDRMMGGDGSYIEVNRDFTEIELGLITNIAKKLCAVQQEAWANHIELEPTIQEIETNSRIIQHIAPDDIVMLVILEVEIKGLTNTISLCIPSINLDKMMTKIGEKNLKIKKQDKVKEGERRDGILSGIKNTELPVKAILCDTEIDLADVLNLQINDIIPLNVGIDQNVELKIGSNKWFDGKMGIKNKNKAIRIDNVFRN